MPSVFLCHSWRDKDFVKNLAKKLRRKDVFVWVDKAELKIGDSLLKKISDAIENVDYVIAVISSTSVKSNWVQKELSLAMDREINGKRVVVLPLVIEDCELPNFLKDKVYADFTNSENYEREFLRLLKVIGVQRVISGPYKDIKQAILNHRCYEFLFSRWKVVYGDGVEKIEQIRTKYIKTPQNVHKRINELAIEKALWIEQERIRNIKIWNGKRFRLIDLKLGGTGSDERLMIDLTFCPSEYSDFLATQEFLNERGNYENTNLLGWEFLGQNYNPLKQVSPDVVSDFAILLLVITKDNKVIISLRFKDVVDSPSLLHTSVHEGLQREIENPDFDVHGNPDVIKAAIRGARQEQGIILNPPEIQWFLFGHDNDTWEYNLVGLVRIQWTFEETQRLFPRDRFEVDHWSSLGIPFNPKDVTNFLKGTVHESLHHSLSPCLYFGLIFLTGEEFEVTKYFNSIFE